MRGAPATRHYTRGLLSGLDSVQNTCLPAATRLSFITNGGGRHMATQVIRMEAPAKINLTLDVLGRRPDGYHELRSVMQTVALADELELAVSPDLALQAEPAWLAGPD